MAGRTVWSRLDLGAYPISLALAGLTCALTPAYTVRWRLGFYPTTLLEAAILLTVAAFAFESWRLRSFPLWRSPLLVPAAIFIVAGAISVVAAPDRRAALGIYRAYIIEPIVFFFVLSTVVNTFKRALLILGGLAAAGVVVGVANSVVVLDAIRHHTLDPAVTAPVIIYTNANDVALFLVPLIAVAGCLVLHHANQRVRLASLAFVVIAVASTLLSFSRGGYLALAAVALGLALSHRRRWWLVGGAVAAAILLVLIPPINHRLAVEVNLSNGSNTLVGRFELWRVSLQMLQQHFLFGAGLSGFSQTIGPYWNPTHTDRFIYPHNIVLTFWSETGLLGLAAFVWIMFTGFVQSWRGWRVRQSEWRPLELGVFLALVAVVVHGLVDVPYFKNDLALEFWVLLGLAWAGNQVAGRRAAQR
ncbi:MAG TPA: O-antigen ligase family protein [Candidatus Dormibacteraeota bacterium]|nr:O-antigen ligase family protein [Candidatus Dormibacteraeota bacterium]